MSNPSKYPKTLIFGYFNQSKPTGITVNNLFGSWPKGRLKIATFGSITNVYSPTCESYYLLGDKEVRFVFPFHLFFNSSPSQIFEGHYTNIGAKTQKSRNPFKIFSNYFINQFLIKTGLYLIKRRIIPSDSFIEW